ncbi:MAG: hypothetical protein IT340_15090 [Chloroflexi bacterium]|nr:hypothetical protein [Chloroflexota bacterium]
MGLSLFFLPLAGDASPVAALLLIAQQMVGDGAYTIAQVNQVSLRQAVTPADCSGA